MWPVVIQVERYPDTMNVMVGKTPRVGAVCKFRYDVNAEHPFSTWREYKVLRKIVEPGNSVRASSEYYLVTPVDGTSEPDPNLLVADSASKND